MATDTWVTIGSFVAAAGSAIAAFYAVRQSVLQRTISIKPQLVIKNIELKMIYTSTGIFPYKTFDPLDEYKIKIPLINIGLGTALNINYRFNFDFREKFKSCGFIESEFHPFTLTNSGSKISTSDKFVFIDDPQNNDFLHYAVSNKSEANAYSIEKENKEVEYLIPITQKPMEESVKIPTLIPKMLIAQAELSSSLTDFMIKEESAGELLITYEDISGKKSFVKYSISMRMLNFQSVGEFGSESSFQIKFKRINKTSIARKTLSKISRFTKRSINRINIFKNISKNS